MKSLFIPLTLVLVLLLSACGDKANNAGSPSVQPSAAAPSETASPSESTPSESGTITYQSENGPVEVPAHPQRVVVLSSFAGNVISLGVPLVGVDVWSKNNPRFTEQLKDVEGVSEDDLEKIVELEPDLIIGLSNTKNVDRLNEIAPTITFTYGKLDYLSQHLEIGKLLNKEQEAQAWVDDFKARAAKAGEEIKAKIGADSTVSVIETAGKQLYVFGDHWARGTEILYQEMKLPMPKKVKEMAMKDGYYALSSEVVADYMGDYVIFSKDSDADNSFQTTESYNKIPAVKNNRVFEVDAKGFYFNDPLTLDYQLDFITKSFLG